MADHSAESMQRERTLNNSEANHGNSNRFLQPQLLTRIPSDGNRNNAHHHSHSPVAHNGRISFIHSSPDKPHETSTDGETGASASVLRRHHHHQTNSNHEHSFLPHTSSARHLSVIPLQQRASHRAVNAPADNGRNHNEIDDEPLNGDDTHRRHIHGAHQPAVLPVKIHRANVSRSPAPLHHDGLVGQPLRFIFMRHSERVNQVLGPEWFIKAFHTHTYQAYDAHLPMVLPKRRFERAYEFDTPLTG